MKAILIACALLALLAPALHAETTLDECVSSDLKTGDAAIVTGKQVVCGYTVHPDGTTSCTIVGYDNASAASGTVLFKEIIGAGIADSAGASLSFRIPSTKGVYVDMTTTGTCGYIVYTRAK